MSVQRSQDKQFKNGKTTSMTKERRRALETLGFTWTLRKRHSWQERFDQLKSFSRAKGSCDVLNEGKNKGLWTWCQSQRAVYRKGVEGRGVAIPKERIAMMETIGFNWTLPVESVSVSSTGSTSTSSSPITQDSPSSFNDAMDSMPSLEI